MTRRLPRTAVAAFICAALAFICVPVSATPRNATVEVAFAPEDDVAGLLVERIARARLSVQVQAYLFTDRRIARALLAARSRGLKVEVIADGAQSDAGGLPVLGTLQRAGARLYVNRAYAASHDKIVIVDGATRGATVLTGSYNFTHAAGSRNAENVVVLSGNRALTDRYLTRFERLRAMSTPWR